MDYFSLTFLGTWLLGLLVFYILNARWQWLSLLIISFILYVVFVNSPPIVLILVSIMTYGATRVIRAQNRETLRFACYSRVIRNIVIIASLFLLIVSRSTRWISNLGNSYFTLKAIGYLIDCERYDDEEYYEKDFLFFVFYLIYFPTVSQGPFNRYRDFKRQFSERIRFEYVGFMHGFQRFLWGTFKKLVITPRLGEMGTLVFENISGISGFALMMGLLAKTIYYYMDFSSYMDMMIGVSSTFGVDIPENFRQPFFSKSIAEFWRRWHMTMGEWFKDYIMIPFIQSKIGRTIKRKAKRYGKDASRTIPLVAGTFLVWIATSMWHGIGRSYFLWGMYYCAIIVLSLLLENRYRRIRNILHINEESLWYSVFRMLRTCILVMLANLIQLSNSFEDFRYALGRIIGSDFFIRDASITLEKLGWGEMKDAYVLVLSLIVFFIVSVLKERGYNILAKLDKCRAPFRWLVYYVIIFTILCFGRYGSGYDPSKFLYTNF